MASDFTSLPILCLVKVGNSMESHFMYLIILILMQFRFINFTTIKKIHMVDGDLISIQRWNLRIKVGNVTGFLSKCSKIKSTTQFQFTNTISRNKMAGDFISVTEINHLLKDGQKTESLFTPILEKFNEQMIQKH